MWYPDAHDEQLLAPAPVQVAHALLQAVQLVPCRKDPELQPVQFEAREPLQVPHDESHAI